MTIVSAIGLMSGTSYDGVDVALINTDGETIGRLGPTGYRAYSDGERDMLRRAIAAAANLGDASCPAGTARRSGGDVDRGPCRGGRGIPGGERNAGARTSRSSASTARPCCTSRSAG